MRLLSRVDPPSAQCRMWWASVQPGLPADVQWLADAAYDGRTNSRVTGDPAESGRPGPRHRADAQDVWSGAVPVDQAVVPPKRRGDERARPDARLLRLARLGQRLVTVVDPASREAFLAVHSWNARSGLLLVAATSPGVQPRVTSRDTTASRAAGTPSISRPAGDHRAGSPTSSRAPLTRSSARCSGCSGSTVAVDMGRTVRRPTDETRDHCSQPVGDRAGMTPPNGYRRAIRGSAAGRSPPER